MVILINFDGSILQIDHMNASESFSLCSELLVLQKPDYIHLLFVSNSGLLPCKDLFHGSCSANMISLPSTSGTNDLWSIGLLSFGDLNAWFKHSIHAKVCQYGKYTRHPACAPIMD